MRHSCEDATKSEANETAGKKSERTSFFGVTAIPKHHLLSRCCQHFHCRSVELKRSLVEWMRGLQRQDASTCSEFAEKVFKARKIKRKRLLFCELTKEFKVKSTVQTFSNNIFYKDYNHFLIVSIKKLCFLAETDNIRGGNLSVANVLQKKDAVDGKKNSTTQMFLFLS